MQMRNARLCARLFSAKNGNSVSFHRLRRASRDAFLSLRLFLAIALCSAGLLLGSFAFDATASNGGANHSHSLSQKPATSKIAPWIVNRTGNGQQAEFLVVLTDQADLRSASALPTKEEKGRYVRDALWNKAQATQGPLLQWLREHNIEHRSYYIVNMIWVKATLDIARTIAARSDVARIEGNPEIRNVIPQPEPARNAPAEPQQTAAIEPGITYTHAPQVWAMGYTGQGIVIAGADTGYLWNHNALINHYRGWDGTSVNHDYNWHDSIHNAGLTNTCGSNSAQPCDDDGHGTHTMGTAVGDDGVGNQIGMAPGAKWIGCRNMDAGNGTPARYIECMEFFLAPYPVNGIPAQGDPSKAPDISTNSWTCPSSEGCSVNDLKAAVEAQRTAGIMMVVAAGNGGVNGCSTVNEQPAIFDAVYSIGALNTGADTLASFSSKGPVTLDGSNRMKPDLCAPGTNTRSSTNASVSAYGTKSGTSMATPHVAGAVALLWSAQPSLRHNVGATENILNQTAAHLNPPMTSFCDPAGTTSPNNVFGYGRLDIKAAVDAALLQVLNITNDGTAVTLTFYGVQGRIYRLERRDDLTPNTSWQSINGVNDVTASTTGPTQVVDPLGGGSPEEFYRVRILLP
jgi:serine protease AprX